MYSFECNQVRQQPLYMQACFSMDAHTNTPFLYQTHIIHSFTCMAEHVQFEINTHTYKTFNSQTQITVSSDCMAACDDASACRRNHESKNISKPNTLVHTDVTPRMYCNRQWCLLSCLNVTMRALVEEPMKAKI